MTKEKSFITLAPARNTNDNTDRDNSSTDIHYAADDADADADADANADAKAVEKTISRRREKRSSERSKPFPDWTRPSRQFYDTGNER